MPYTFNHLPLYARLTIERMDCDRTLRNSSALDGLATSYASSYGLTVDTDTRNAIVQICQQRFGASFDS